MEAEEPDYNALIDLSMVEDDEDESVSSLGLLHKDNNRTPCAELKGTDLEWSTVRTRSTASPRSVFSVDCTTQAVRRTSVCTF